MRHGDLIEMLGGIPAPKEPINNPPLNAPEVLARLINFEADDKWIRTYSEYCRKEITKGQAANYGVGVGIKEFEEQIRLYKATPEKKQEMVYTMVLQLLVQCLNLNIPKGMQKFEDKYLKEWFDKQPEEVVQLLKDKAYDIWNEMEGE